MSFDMTPASPARALATAGESLYSDALGRAVCARVAAGESLRRIGAEAGQPSPQTVWTWSRRHPAFGDALAAAQKAARVAARLRDRVKEAARPGRVEPWRKGAAPLYCEGLAEEICRRLIEGETLQQVCRDPDMPCWSTIFAWLRKHPEFEEMYVMARMAAGDWLADEALEAARGASPETVWADRLRHDGARRAAAQRAPRKYDGRLVVALAAHELREAARAEREGGGGLTVIVKRYCDVTEEEMRLAAEGEP